MSGMAWLDHPGTLCLDAPEGYNECPAVYQMQVEYYRGRPDNFVRATLMTWTFNGREQSRMTAVEMLGEDEVSHQEQLALDAYAEGPHERLAG